MSYVLMVVFVEYCFAFSRQRCLIPSLFLEATPDMGEILHTRGSFLLVQPAGPGGAAGGGPGAVAAARPGGQLHLPRTRGNKIRQHTPHQ